MEKSRKPIHKLNIVVRILVMPVMLRVSNDVTYYQVYFLFVFDSKLNGSPTNKAKRLNFNNSSINQNNEK